MSKLTAAIPKTLYITRNSLRGCRCSRSVYYTSAQARGDTEVFRDSFISNLSFLLLS
jgi:hypothetical protein